MPQPENSLELPVETYIPENKSDVEVTDDAVYSGMSDDEFWTAYQKRLQRANAEAAELQIKDRQKVNLKYYLGEQIVKSQLRDDQEKNVDNVIFRNVETIIAAVTANPPEPTMTPAYKNEETRKFAATWARAAVAEWEVYQDMALKVSRGIRNHQTNLLAAFQLGYDPDTDEFWTEEVPATELVVSRTGDFVARFIKDKDLGYILDTFPEKKKEVLQSLGYTASIEVTKTLRASPVEYVDVWMENGGSCYVGWVLDNVVLGFEENPHFDYEGEEVPVVDPATGEPMLDDFGMPIVKKVHYNHFKKARIPYLFMQHINRGRHVYDDTTLVEQGIGPQDWINKRKRQIGANADSTNGHWVTSSEFMDEEEFKKIEGGIDEKIFLSRGMPRDGIVKITGQELPVYIYQDLIDSRASLDNIMGTHSVTRGEAGTNETLGQDVLQRDQDLGRMDGYVRDAIEHFAEDWFEYLYHLYLVYRVKEKAIAAPEDDDFETDNILFSRKNVPIIQDEAGNMFPCPMLIRVKKGSTLPKDEVFEYNKAFMVRDLMSPLDFFKKVGETNPRELYKNKLISDTDPFYFFKDDPDVQQFIAFQQQKAMQQMAAQGAQEAGMSPEGQGADPVMMEKAQEFVDQPGFEGLNAEDIAGGMASLMQESE